MMLTGVGAALALGAGASLSELLLSSSLELEDAGAGAAFLGWAGFFFSASESEELSDELVELEEEELDAAFLTGLAPPLAVALGATAAAFLLTTFGASLSELLELSSDESDDDAGSAAFLAAGGKGRERISTGHRRSGGV